MDQVTIGGQQLAYEIYGSGHPVLAVRNIAQPPELWPGPFIDQVTDAGYQVVTFQHLGARSGSMADIAMDVSGLLDHLALDSLRVWGYSGGAMLAQEVVIRRPDLVRSAIFMATTGRLSALLKLSLRAYEALVRHQPDVLDAFAYLTLVTSMSPQLLTNDDYVLATAAAITPEVAYASEDARRRWFDALAVYDDRRADLAKITAPSMVISFESDMIMLAADGRGVADAIPECKYVQIAGAGHDGMWTHSDAVMKHVLDFFAST